MEENKMELFPIKSPQRTFCDSGFKKAVKKSFSIKIPARPIEMQISRGYIRGRSGRGVLTLSIE